MANRAYKGRRLEIRIAKILSEWWTQDLDEPRTDVFWHTHDSGGRATKRAAKGKGTKNSHGDIFATDPIGQPLIDVFTIECKKGYNDISIQDLIDKPKPGILEKWIKKLQKTAMDAGSYSWLLIVERDLRTTLAIAPSYPFISCLGSGIAIISVESLSDEIGITALGKFLQQCTPERVKYLAAEHCGGM